MVENDDEEDDMFPSQPILAPISKRFKSTPTINPSKRASPTYHTRSSGGEIGNKNCILQDHIE